MAGGQQSAVPPPTPLCASLALLEQAISSTADVMARDSPGADPQCLANILASRAALVKQAASLEAQLGGTSHPGQLPSTCSTTCTNVFPGTGSFWWGCGSSFCVWVRSPAGSPDSSIAAAKRRQFAPASFSIAISGKFAGSTSGPSASSGCVCYTLTSSGWYSCSSSSSGWHCCSSSTSGVCCSFSSSGW